MGNRPRIRHLIPPLALAAFIFFITSVRLPDAFNQPPWIIYAYVYDSQGHFLLFSLLALLVGLLGFRQSTPYGALIWTLLLVGLFACASEAYQHFRPGRDMDWTDLRANFAGTIAGAFLALIVRLFPVAWHARKSSTASNHTHHGSENTR